MTKAINLPNGTLITDGRALFASIKQRFPFLHYAALLNVIFFVACFVLMLFDHRQLSGVNIWIKPAKFLISIPIFLWTLGWYLLIYPFRERTKNILAGSFTVLLCIENSIIIIQAGRGQLSHYNVSTPFNAMMFATMGIAILLVTLLSVWMLIKSFSPKSELSTSMKWTTRIAWVIFILASFVGRMMIDNFGHNVGVPDGGEGLPFLNWSTKGGDLRAAHFFGLHAIQLLPLATYFILKKIPKPSLATGLSIGVALVYFILFALIFLLANTGQPLLEL